jgi:hypothetical protein
MRDGKCIYVMFRMILYRKRNCLSFSLSLDMPGRVHTRTQMSPTWVDSPNHWETPCKSPTPITTAALSWMASVTITLTVPGSVFFVDFPGASGSSWSWYPETCRFEGSTSSSLSDEESSWNVWRGGTGSGWTLYNQTCHAISYHCKKLKTRCWGGFRHPYNQKTGLMSGFIDLTY